MSYRSRVSDRTTPLQIEQAGPTTLRIRWKDGAEISYPVRRIRISCRCARCVEEGTGRPLLRAEDVPLDVHPVRIHLVGRYGIQIAWSDGHDTGIYTFEMLRRLAAEG